jgi:hypothetical protein
MQMHREENYTATSNWVDEFQQKHTHHWQWLQTDHGPDKSIWMQAADSRVPNCKPYPLTEICATVPGADLRWFTSTAAYALALGIYMGYEVIDIYGVELSSNTEYYIQLHNWQYWVGVAKGMGITVGLYSGQKHFSDRLYAYEGETQIERSLFANRAHELHETWQKEEHKAERIKKNLDQAMLDHKYDETQKLIIALREQLITSGRHSGAMAEAERYSKRPDPISRQEYEMRIAKASNEGEGHRALMYHVGGKIEYVWNVWKQNSSYEALKQLRLFVGEQTKTAYDFGAHLGIGSENEDYIHQYDARLDAAGGKRAIMALEGEKV